MLALSWGIQASHEMPLPAYPVSFETLYTATLLELFCTTKGVGVRVSNVEVVRRQLTSNTYQ